MFKKLIVIIIIGAVIYSAYLYAEPYYTYYMFKTDVDEYVKVAIDFKKEVRNEVFRMAQTYDIPIEKDQIYLKRDPGKPYIVKVSWSKKVDWFTLYQRTFKFSVNTEKW